jgi:hypothetical protein
MITSGTECRSPTCVSAVKSVWMVFEPGAAAPTRLTRSGGPSRWTVGLGDVDCRVGFAYTMTAVFEI